MRTLQDVIKTVQNLIKVAESTNHDGERDAAQYKAQQLITQYQIDQEQIDNGVIYSDVIEMRIDCPGPLNIEKSILLNVIANNNFCKVLRGRDYLMIYGYKSDIDICLELYKPLKVHMLGEMAREHKRSKEENPYGPVNRNWSRDFCLGYTDAINSRLARAREAVLSKAMSSSKAVTVFVKDKQHAVEEYFQGVTKTAPTQNRARSLDVYNLGNTSGSNADLQQTKFSR